MTKKNPTIDVDATLEEAKSVLSTQSNLMESTIFSESKKNFLKVFRCSRSSVSAPQSRSSSIRKIRADDNVQTRERRRNSLPLDCCKTNTLPFSCVDGHQRGWSRETFQRVRSFKLTSKGLVNHGDSFRNRERSKLSTSSGSFKSNKRQRLPSETSIDTDSSGSYTNEYYRIAILGAHSVGKTALMNQFMTSEYIGGQDATGTLLLFYKLFFSMYTWLNFLYITIKIQEMNGYLNIIVKKILVWKIIIMHLSFELFVWYW